MCSYISLICFCSASSISCDCIEDTAFKLLLCIPEDMIPSSLMNWTEHYIDKRMNELQYQLIRDNWRSVELEKAAVQLNSKN